MKVSAKQVNYIMHKRDKRWTTYLFHWTLVPIAPRRTDDGPGYCLSAQWKTPAKILWFTIWAIILIPFCCWEGGLKDYPEDLKSLLWLPPKAEAWQDHEISMYKRMKEVYEKHSKHE